MKDRAELLGKLFFVYLVLWFIAGLVLGAHAEPPHASLPYRGDIIRVSRATWGLTAPIALFAGQIEQESAWDAKVCSPFACGLAQFTPGTAADISRQLGVTADVFNPAWAIRAMTTYDRNLYTNFGQANDDCNRWAFTLSAYNGGLGNVRRDQEYYAASTRRTPSVWFGGVDAYSRRSGEAFRENRGYPSAILLRRQANYTTWGATVPCRST